MLGSHGKTMKDKQMKKSGLLLISALLAGCHGVTFNSNLGSYTLAKTKTLIVEEYSVAEIAGFNAELLGIIGASYCQARADEGKPSRRALVNELKIKAFDLGANALVVDACGITRQGTCLAYMECQGAAYSLPGDFTEQG